MGLLVATVSPAPVFGDEVSVKNDSVVDGSTAVLQLGFDPGESAAAWLTSPCNGEIVAVQVFWKSASGGAPPSLESSIHIFQAGTFPVPGPSLAFLEGPVMTDGVLNEFRYLDEEQTIPIEVPVANGQVFVVSFKFDSNPSGANGGPTVVTDSNGCQNGKNAIDGIGVGWFNPCAIGMSGDFMIRAVVECPAATGACCLPNGTCNPSMSASLCTSAGGTFQGIDSICPPSCPILTGACCKPDGSCVGGVTQSVCQGTHLGTYQGHGTNCGTVNCPQPPQACCNPANGFCSMQVPDTCINFNGVPQGAGTVCVGTSSNQCPRGACCLPSGQCAENKTPVECASMSGAYQGTGTTCAQANCPQPQGACCLTGGGCTVSDQTTCEGFGHEWMGSGTDCSDLNGNTIADACESCDPPDGNMSGDAVTDGRDVGYFVAALLAMSTNEGDLCHGDFVVDGIILDDDIPGMVDRLLVNP
ncbi:MAG TPA: hypothetical protein VJZ71_21555 [Phycisphaerae bacterium]|nr:hypothetical protein [Phycisphaerae bacterium]